MSRIRSKTSVSLVARVNDFEGYLQKRGGWIKTWKTRWFEMKDGALRYYRNCYEDKKAINTLYLGAASSCEVCSEEMKPSWSPSPYSFYIRYDPHRRNYYFSASTKEEMLLWVTKIQQYLRTKGPKNSREWARKHAKALDKPASLGNCTSVEVEDDEDSVDTDDIFEQHKMRSYSPGRDLEVSFDSIRSGSSP